MKRNDERAQIVSVLALAEGYVFKDKMEIKSETHQNAFSSGIRSKSRPAKKFMACIEESRIRR